MFSILPHISVAFIVVCVAFVFSSDGRMLASLFVSAFMASKFVCLPLLSFSVNTKTNTNTDTASTTTTRTNGTAAPPQASLATGRRKESAVSELPALTAKDTDTECLQLVAHQYLPKLTMQLDDSRHQTHQAMTQITANFGELNKRLSPVLSQLNQTNKDEEVTEQLLASILTELQFHDRVEQIQACTSEGLAQLIAELKRYQKLRANGEEVRFQTQDIDLALSRMPAETQKHSSNTDGDRLTFF